MNTQHQDNIIRWLTAAASYFVLVIAFYINIGQDMGAQYFMPILLPILAALLLAQYGSRIPLFSWASLPNLLTGLGWCTAFPLLYAWTYHSVWYQSKICIDFIVGTSAFILLTALEASLYRLGHVKITAAYAALVHLHEDVGVALQRCVGKAFVANITRTVIAKRLHLRCPFS